MADGQDRDAPQRKRRPFKPFGAKRSAHGRGAPRSADRRGGGGREDGLAVLYGHHPVVEALANPRRVIHRLLATENAAHKLRQTLPDLAIEPTLVRPEDIGRQLTADAVHQGVLLLAEPLPHLSLAAIAEAPLVLVLDEVTDPHNVGAVIRSAAAFGVDALVTTARHSPDMTGVLAKAASGALEHVPVVVVNNLARTLAAMGEAGRLRIGLDSAGESELGTLALRPPLALVLGAEGKGLRPSTRAACDSLARLDLPGAIKSLNVSNAAAIALYALTRKIPFGQKLPSSTASSAPANIRLDPTAER